MKNLFLLSFLLLPAYIFSQTVTVSEPLSMRSDQSYEVIGKMKDRFLLYRDKTNNAHEIQAFRENLQLSWRKELTFDKKRTEVVGIVPDKDYFSIIYRFKNKGKTILKVNRYDAGANLKDSTTIYNYGSRFYPPRAEMIRSEDRSKILLYSIERQTKIEAICFDLKEMKLLWTNSFSPDGMTFHVDYEQPLITNAGRMYYILGKDNRKSNRNEHLYEFYTANTSSAQNKLDFFTVKMQNKLTFDVLFQYDNLNNNIIAGGLYSEKNRGRANGCFYMKISANNMDTHELSFIPFDDKFVSDFLGKKFKENKGIPETVVKEIVLRRDGGIIMIAERNRLLERQMASTARGGYIGVDGRGYIVDYHYEDIAMVSIHPNGEVHWLTTLPKRQYSQDDDAIFSSFFLLKTPSALRILFNDEIKYENTVSEYVVNGKGEYDRNSVLSTFNQQLQLRFQAAVQVASNALLIPSQRKNRLRLVKVAF